MSRLIIALIFCVTGCTINVVDKRISREEVSAALKERDAALVVLANAIKDLQGGKKNEKSK